MLKSFVLIDTLFLDESVKCPAQLTENYIIYEFNKGNYPYRDQLHQWAKENHCLGSFTFIIEIKKEYSRKTYHHNVYEPFVFLVSILRLIQYNRVHFRHIVNIENDSVVMSSTNDSSRPSSFLGKDEEVSVKTLQNIEKIMATLKIILKKQRNMRLINSILFWDTSSCSGNFERKTIEIFTSLESLFGGKTEITYKLANRVSWFLGTHDPEIRRKIFDLIRSGYNIRSKIVHGELFKKAPDFKTIKEIHALARDAILKILYDVKLTEIFSSNQEQLDDYLYNLVVDKH